MKCLKNNEAIEPLDSLQIHYNDILANVSLHVKDIPPTSAEIILVYTIEAENEFGRAVGTAQLVFHAALHETSSKLVHRAARVTPLIPEIVAPGSTLIFTSEFDGFPEPEIKWIRNGKDIIENEDITIVTENRRSTITVRNMVRQKAGKYEIVAINEAGESRASGSVTISTDQTGDDLRAPKFKISLLPKSVLDNQVVIMETVIDSNPVSSFQWSFNSAPIQTTSTTRINSKDNHSILIVECITYENSGMYTCRGENVLGSITSSATVRVVDKETQLEETQGCISPRFIEKLKPIQLMDGELMRLACRVIGYPTPKIHWMHNKHAICEVKGVDLWQDGDGLTVLTISEVFPEDAGEYSCHATNKFGIARSKTNVIVEGILDFVYLFVWYAKSLYSVNTTHLYFICFLMFCYPWKFSFHVRF